MKKSIFFLLLCVRTYAQDPCPEPEPCCKLDTDPKTEYRQRITLKTTQGDGIGFDEGYSSLEAFLSHDLSRKLQDTLLIADGRGHLFNNGLYAFNGGLGLRKFYPLKSLVFGGNAYYDYRKIHHGFFQQVGLGVEALWQYWTIRANGYIPIGPTARRKGSVKFDEFKGHKALFKKPYEVDFYGADVEVGGTLFKKNWFELDGMLGGYYLTGKMHNQGGGGLARVSLKMSSYVTLEGQTSYDNLFKWTGWGRFAFNYPFGKKARVRCEPCCEKSGDLAARMAEPVSRFEIMPIHKTKKTAPALDAKGDPLFFVFVDELSEEDGDGSFEHPFNNLVEAENSSDLSDLIYVFEGEETTVTTPILESEPQILRSESPHSFPTEFGPQTIPAQTESYYQLFYDGLSDYE